MSINKEKITIFTGLILLLIGITLVFSPINSYAEETAKPNKPIIKSFEQNKIEDNALTLTIDANNEGNNYYIHVYSPTMERKDNYVPKFPLTYQALGEGEEQSVMAQVCKKQNNEYVCSEWTETHKATPSALPEEDSDEPGIDDPEEDQECPENQEYNPDTKACEPADEEETEVPETCPEGQEWDGEDCVKSEEEDDENQDSNESNILKKIEFTKAEYAKLKYTGKQRTPGVVVYNANGEKLVKGTDYTVTYPTKRTNIGEYKVTVKGIGKYTGTLSKTFKIFPKASSITKLTPGNNNVTVTLKKIAGGVSYKVLYKRNIDTAWSNYKTTSSTSVKISSLKSGTKYDFKVITYKKVKEKTYKSDYSKVKSTSTTGTKSIKATLAYTKTTYTGSQKSPAVTVYGSDGKKLTKGTHYTVSYPNASYVGSYEVTVKAKNGYSGTKKPTFVIVPANGSISGVKQFLNSIVLTIKAPSYKPAGGLIYQVQYRKDGTTTWSNAPQTSAGATSVNIGGLTSNTKYNFRLRTGLSVRKVPYWNDYSSTIKTYSTTANKTLTNITSSNVAITVTHPNNSIYYHYTGNAKKPTTVSLKNKVTNTKLALGKDYKATYSNNVEVGVAKLTLTGIGDYTGTKIYSYVIKPKTPVIKSISNIKKTSVTVNVKTPAGNTKNIRYIYYYKLSSASSYTKSGGGTASMSKTISGLKSGKKYNFKVKAYTVNYSGSPTAASAAKSAKTK